MSEKLQKVLARAGYGARREMENWIASGRVSVNGKTATVGDRVEPTDRVLVDGRPLRQVEKRGARRRVLIYHKPVGEVCTREDPEGRPTIFERLPRLAHGRWVAVGRLDLNTSGLLVLTTDGELANRLMHPSYEIEREYAVRVLGEVTPDVLKRLTTGIELDDGVGRFERIVDSGGEGVNHWYHVVLKEGRKREVRRLWETEGFTVSRLHRIRYGPVVLPRRVRAGRWEELSPEAVGALLEAVGMARPRPRVDHRRGGRGRRRR